MAAVLNIELDAESSKIKAVLAAMHLERQDTRRCKIVLTPHRNSRRLTIKLLATDLTSLRAALNTSLRLVATSINAIDAMKKRA